MESLLQASSRSKPSRGALVVTAGRRGAGGREGRLEAGRRSGDKPGGAGGGGAGGGGQERGGGRLREAASRGRRDGAAVVWAAGGGGGGGRGWLPQRGRRGKQGRAALVVTGRATWGRRDGVAAPSGQSEQARPSGVSREGTG